MGEIPEKTLLDKPAVASKFPKADFFNGLLTVGFRHNVDRGPLRGYYTR